MGEAEVAAVREMYDAFNRGEYEEATAMLDEDVVFHQWEEIPDADTYEGREGLVRGLVRWLEGFGPRPSECWVFSSEDEAWRHARDEG